MHWRNLLIGGLAAASLLACGGGGSSSAPPPVQQPPPAPVPPPPPPPPVNSAPAVAINTPLTGNSFTVGGEIVFEGAAVDPEDGALDGALMVWTEGDTQLATGRSFAAGSFTEGMHTVRLTATDSQGLTAMSSVSFRVAPPAAAPTPRKGELNPYAGRLSRKPVKRDDEPVFFGRSDSQNRMIMSVVDRTVSRYGSTADTTAVPPRTLKQVAATYPLAGASGRILKSNYEQAAVALRSTQAGGADRFRVDILSLLVADEPTAASVNFEPPIPDGAIDVAVADLDAFEEGSGVRRMTAPADGESEYHAEVALAYAEISAGQLRARVHVYSFEDVIQPDAVDDPVPGPTSSVNAQTSAAILPGSRLVLRSGDTLFTSDVNPHLLVGYLDLDRRINIDVFRYEHTRADPNVRKPRSDARSLSHVLHTVLGNALRPEAAAAGGWDLVVANGPEIGVDQTIADFIIVARHANGQYVQEMWQLNNRDGIVSPWMVGSDTNPFGVISNGAPGGFAVSILPDARIRAVVGRIVDAPPARCEALGVHVMADTNRGPVVQSMKAFVADLDVGPVDFNPVTATGWVSWHDTALAGADTAQIGRTSIVAGGLVSLRNGLIGERDRPPGGGTEIARQCNDTQAPNLLGRMPSFYVVDPGSSMMHAVTLPLGRVSGVAPSVATAIDAGYESVPVLLAADADGDAGYYNARTCVPAAGGGGQGSCVPIYLGDAEYHYMLENIQTMNVVLQQPPKHVDYLHGLGGMVNVSMQDGFFAEFGQTNSTSGQIRRQTKTDWSVGAGFKLASGPSEPDDELKKVKKSPTSSTFELSIDLEHRSVRDDFNSSEVTVSLTQTTGAVDDDVVWSKIQTTDFWRFPVQGGKAENQPNSTSPLTEDAFMEIAIPGEPLTSIGPGSLDDSYQPTHQPGNILTYPTIAGASQDVGSLFDLLGGYVPTAEDGSKECVPFESDINGCIALINGELARVQTLLQGQVLQAGRFETETNPVDIADVLQVGGITYDASLEFSETVKRGSTVTNTDSIKGEYKVKLEHEGKSRKRELEAKLSASASFESAQISENTLGAQTRIALHVPSSIPASRSYRIRPSFGFTPEGTLKVSYEVGTEGAAATFWQQNYSRPDAALNLPYRIVRNGEAFELNTDFSRNRMKGFMVRDGAGIDPLRPAMSVGRLLSAAPLDGDRVQLEARVYNLSVATPLSGVTVRFSAQEYVNGALAGQPLVLGDAAIDFIAFRGEYSDVPDGHVASAYLVWDTTGFGPASGQSLKTYVIFVTVDPDDHIPNETHELLDRYADPLRGPGGVAVDDQLEKGQNNRGWGMVRVAPSLAATTASKRLLSAAKIGSDSNSTQRYTAPRVSMNLLRKSPLASRAPLPGKLGRTMTVGIELMADELSTDYGILQLFDGDPDSGGRLLATQRVQGVAGDGTTVEDFTWRPRRDGDHVLYARYFGAGGRTQTLQIPARIAR